MRETILYKPHALWLWLRIAVCAVAVIAGGRASVELGAGLREFPLWMLALVGVFSMVMFGAFPPLGALIEAFGDYIHLKKKSWRRPTFMAPPLPLNSLVVVHIFGYMMLATGAGGIAAVVWGGWSWLGLWCAATGSVVLVMLRITMQHFHHRMADIDEPASAL